jgi:hypothetical protein
MVLCSGFSKEKIQNPGKTWTVRPPPITNFLKKLRRITLMSTCVNRSGQISPLILSLLATWSLPCHLMVLSVGFSKEKNQGPKQKMLKI